MIGSKIKSIKSLGKRKTYNVTMSSEQHNYSVIDITGTNKFISANSHACGYGFMSYSTAYLKSNYPDEFICSYLNVETKRSKWEKVDTLLNEAGRMDIEILPKKVSICGMEYKIIKKKDKLSNIPKTQIQPGIMCKGLSRAAAEDIVDKQPFKNLKDFAMRTNTKDVDIRSIDALVEGKFFKGADHKKIREQFRAAREDRKRADRKGIQDIDMFE